jgi:quercetin dioxygenase-like cupin family protein
VTSAVPYDDMKHRTRSEGLVTMRPNDDLPDFVEPVRLLVTGADTKGRLALAEIRATRGAEPPRHLHHWEDEIVYVLAGEVTFYVDGAPLARPAGTCVVLAAGREHAYAVASEEARLLVIAVPAGLEDLYAELDGANAGNRPDIERLVAIAARYGVEVTGPPAGPS